MTEASIGASFWRVTLFAALVERKGLPALLLQIHGRLGGELQRGAASAAAH